jgi:hypothetical protein
MLFKRGMRYSNAAVEILPEKELFKLGLTFQSKLEILD